MQNTVAVFSNQPINHSALVRQHGILVNEAPVSLLEGERFLTGYLITGVAIPCDQLELREFPNDKSVRCRSHEVIMLHEWSIFQRKTRKRLDLSFMDMTV